MIAAKLSAKPADRALRSRGKETEPAKRAARQSGQ
jgi:hypothetical protein